MSLWAKCCTPCMSFGKFSYCVHFFWKGGGGGGGGGWAAGLG